MGSLGTNLAATIAFSRFGFGGAPADVVPADPVGWLESQIYGPDPYTGDGLPTTDAALTQFQNFKNAGSNPPLQALITAEIWLAYATEVDAILTNALTTTAPFRERLVWFWSNHFALMASTFDVAGLAGPFVREAIRPHVNGTFNDMLQAVMQHPGMIMSLNNENSVGPRSVTALECVETGCGPFGINENLGRECLELHTVGITENYSQADVTAMAMLLSGCSVNYTTAPRGFTFIDNDHQPGTTLLLGQAFAPGLAGLGQALAFLATHPFTYAHLATKLVTHFVSDTPAKADIQSVTNALAATGGNLAAATRAVLALPSAWLPGGKLRTPFDYVVATLRAAGVTGAGPAGTALNMVGALRALGQPIWQPQFPNGYSDMAAGWLGPAPLLLRSDWINNLGYALGPLDPFLIADTSLGPLLRPATVTAIQAAGSQHDQLALLFCSPEFQRR